MIDATGVLLRDWWDLGHDDIREHCPRLGGQDSRGARDWIEIAGQRLPSRGDTWKCIIWRHRRSRYDLPVLRARVGVDAELGPQTNRRRMADAWVTVHFIGKRVEIPGLATCLAIMLAT